MAAFHEMVSECLSLFPVAVPFASKSTSIHYLCDKVWGRLFILIAFLLKPSAVSCLKMFQGDIFLNDISPRTWKMLILLLSEQELSKWRGKQSHPFACPVRHMNNPLTSVTEDLHFYLLHLGLSLASVYASLFLDSPYGSVCIGGGPTGVLKVHSGFFHVIHRTLRAFFAYIC